MGIALATWWAATAAAGPAPLEIDQVAPSWSEPADTTPISSDAWWMGFGDERLDRLVERGLDQNLTIAQLAEVLEAEKGARLASASSLVPGVSFDMGTNAQPLDVVFRCNVGPIDPDEFAALQGGGPTTGTGSPPAAQTASLCWTGNALLNVGWNIDLFGRSYLGLRAAQQSTKAAQQDVQGARLTVSAAIATAYVDLLSLRTQEQILTAQLQSQSDLLEILELRYAQGGAAGLDVLQQRQTVATTTASIPAVRSAVEAQGRAIRAALGLGPQSDLEVAQAMPEPTSTPSVGTPADLLERRPDLKAALHRVGQAKAQHQSAVRGFLPSVGVSANAGINYAVASEWSSIDTWGFGGSVSIPIFNGGAVHGTVRQTAALRTAQVRAYDNALINAVVEVDNALTQEREQAARHEATKAQELAARQAFEEATAQYLNGFGNFLNVLAAQGALQGSELALVQAHRDRLVARIQLWTALGGSTAIGESP
ncbi:MAG: efflux transporter outer membrane subunit [Myxococcales bacterium]|nr:efflux transporter outer membrane subunit [Myxococcales bacterium]